MKRGVLLTIVLALLLLVPIFSEREDEDGWYAAAKELYDISTSVNCDEICTRVYNAKNTIFYTNAKSIDKYRLMRILEFVENEVNNASVKNTEGVSIAVKICFGECKIYKEDEFYAQIRRIYNACVQECAECNESSFKNVREEKYIKGMFYNGCGRTACGADGELWVYGKNYFCSLDKNDFPLFAAIDVKTGGNSLLHKLNSKTFFVRRNVESTLVSSDENVEKYKIAPFGSTEYIIAEKDLAQNRLFFFEFIF